jgi:hypothetical protein
VDVVVDELEDDGLLEHAAATTGITARPIANASHLCRGERLAIIDPSRFAAAPRACIFIVSAPDQPPEGETLGEGVPSQ